MNALSLALALLPLALSGAPNQPRIERLDAGLDDLLDASAKVEVLADGFDWSEGPVWKGGELLFSDVPQNTIFSWREGQSEAQVFQRPSGGREPTAQGSNGLALDAQGRLILCQHGDRRVAMLVGEKWTGIAERFQGKRFNSPNDLCISSKGTIFFTDPPYGLKGAAPEMNEHGVYAVQPGGEVLRLISDLKWPNGIALSPDESKLYIAVSDREHPRVMVYELKGNVGKSGGVDVPQAVNGREFFNAQPLKSQDRKGGCDGLKVDARGNVWTTGPGGVLVLSSEGRHLGTILTGQATANCAWGGSAKDALYITADMHLMRVKTKTTGR
jgi:gluconolactonase